RTAGAEHARDKFLCNYEFAQGCSVMCGQYQPRKTLLHRMMLTARNRLADHCQKHLSIVKQERLERTAETNFGPQRCGFHSQCSARNLYQGFVRRSYAAQENVDADHSLVTDHADFDRPAIVHSVNHGDERIFRKVHILDFLIGLIEGRGTFQFDVLHFGYKASVFRTDQGAKDGVPDRKSAFGLSNFRRHFARPSDQWQLPSTGRVDTTETVPLVQVPQFGKRPVFPWPTEESLLSAHDKICAGTPSRHVNAPGTQAGTCNVLSATHVCSRDPVR